VARDLIAEFEKVWSCNGDWKWLLEELVGSKQFWLGACRQAVAQGRGDWLARFLPEQADPHWFLELLAYCNPESAVHWQWAHLLDPGGVGELGARAACAKRSALRGADPRQRQAEAMVQELKRLQEDWQLAPTRDLLLFFLGRKVDVWDRVV
jgi:hypothetical protein